MTEFWQVMKQHWLVLLITVILFASLRVLYPYTPMGKQQFARIEATNRANAARLYQFGMMSAEDKQWYYEHYGWTEEDYSIELGDFLEKSN